MSAVPDFPRITIEEGKKGGLPCIRGYRMPVTSLLMYLSNGMSHEEIFREWPYLEEADIVEALAYAAEHLAPARAV